MKSSLSPCMDPCDSAASRHVAPRGALDEGEGCGHWVQEVKAKEYVARPAMLGLGAKPSEILQRPPKKHIRQVATPHF